MTVTPGQSRIAFAAIVVAFAALGAFLLVPRSQPGSSGHAPASGAATQPASAAASSATVPPATSAPATPAASAAPASAAPPSASPVVNIYRLLPFTQAGLDRAVAVTRKFATDYGTFSYRQSAAAYVAAMRGLLTSPLAATLARAYSTPGVAKVRSQQQQVSSGSAVITKLRAFGPASLTFVVNVVQTITAVPGKSRLATNYAVTLIMAGGHWRVNDIELATAGNS